MMRGMAEPADDAPKRGRPTKLTPDLALGVAQCIQEGNFRYVAGKRYAVFPQRFRRWMQQGKRFPAGIYGQFRALVLEAEAEAERAAVAAIIAAGRENDPRHLEWWLERKFPQRWGRDRGELAKLRAEVAELRKALGIDEGSPSAAPG